jgi:ribonuclease HI
MGMALRCVIQSPPVQYSAIFTDSDYVHGLLERNARVGQNRQIILAVKLLLEEARSVGLVYIIWIKSHAGYHGNEMADQLAKDGAEGNTELVDTGHIDFLL